MYFFKHYSVMIYGHSLTSLSSIQLEKVFSHAWRGRHGYETTEESEEQSKERRRTPEEIQEQFIDDEQVHTMLSLLSAFIFT